MTVIDSMVLKFKIMISKLCNTINLKKKEIK